MAKNFNKGCGLLVAKTRDGEIKCGQEMFGKKRYCAYCSQVTSTTSTAQDDEEITKIPYYPVKPTAQNVNG